MMPLPEWLDSVKNLQAPRYLIEGLLPANHLALLSGPPKDGKKTWLAMLAALCVASGRSTTHMKVGAPEPVLYIYMEGDAPNTRDRFLALLAGHDLGSPDALSNFHFLHRSSKFLLDSDACVDDICQIVQAKGIKLVVVDTLAKTMKGDESSAKDVNKVIRNAERIRNAGCAILLVHHLRKEQIRPGGDKQALFDPDQEVRGSSSLSAAYETHWAVRTGPETSSEKSLYFLIQSKESPWQQATCKWLFEAGTTDTEDGQHKQLLRATLELGELTERQSVEVKKTVTRPLWNL